MQQRCFHSLTGLNYIEVRTRIMKWRLQLCFFPSAYCLLKYAKEKQHMHGYGDTVNTVYDNEPTAISVLNNNICPPQ
jgi:hypothetical protein